MSKEMEVKIGGVQETNDKQIQQRERIRKHSPEICGTNFMSGARFPVLDSPAEKRECYTGESNEGPVR